MTMLAVEHRDRVARFGVDQLESALAATGRQIVVVSDDDTNDELVGDMVEVLSWMCARRYGRGGARNRAEKAMQCAGNDVGPASSTVC